MKDAQILGAAVAETARLDGINSPTRWSRFRRFWLRRDALFVLVLALYASLFGLTTNEMEFHEIFVVQTAGEMQQRGDYLVPYFNAELRLTKPPMNYWLTAACAWIRGAEHPETFDGRLPSALAGVALIIVTVLLGSELWTRAVGLNAGLILCGSFAFVRLSHSARPEMVYAALCAGAFYCFVAAWKRNARSHLPWLGWVLVALATLTKGPQFPALMLGGLAIALAFHGPSRRLLPRVFRPIRGLLMLAVLAGWWWLAVRASVGAEALAQSQLLGSRFLLGFGAWNHPAYFYFIFGTMLPWVFLFIPMIKAGVNRRNRRGFAARALAIVLLIGIVILNFGNDKRAHYLLPLLPLAAILMALGARTMFARLSTRTTLRGRAIIVLVVSLLTLLGIAACRMLMPVDVPRDHLDIMLAVNGFAIALTTALAFRGRHLREFVAPFGVPFGLQWAGVLAVALSTTMLVTRILSSDRLDQRRRSADMVVDVPEDAVLISIGVEPHYIIHYAGRRVISPLSVDTFLTMKHESAWIVTDEPTSQELARHGSIREVDRVEDCDGPVDWVLAYWQAAPAQP